MEKKSLLKPPPVPTVSIRLTADEIKRLDRVCAALDRKRAAIVKICFREHFPILESEAREKLKKKRIKK